MAWRTRALALLAAAAAALAVVAVLQAHGEPERAPGGAGTAALAVQLAAALALAAATVETARRRELATAAALLAALVGLAIHALPEPPESAALFTLALAGASLPAFAAAHVALLHPGGRAAGTLDRVGAAAGYVVAVGLAGVVPALLFDPRESGCFDCPDNLLLVHGDPEAAGWAGDWGARAAAVTAIALAVIVALRLVRRPPAARSLAVPVSGAAVAALALAAVEELRAAADLGATATDERLWVVTAAALLMLAAGVFWRSLRAVWVRGALARLAVAAPGYAEDVAGTLGRALGDPDVAVLVPHPETRAPLAVDGTPAPAVAPSGRTRTAVERRGAVVAWVEHRDDLRATPDLAATAVRSAGLALEHEALRAAQRVQAAELRESTARLVSAGDAERRRLERDLHDGAQQRLLALGLGLARARTSASAAAAGTLTRAEAQAASIGGELRQIAHGIHSVTLAEGGLAEAVLALVQDAAGRVTVEALPERRASAAAEAAVYRLVAASLPLGRTVRVALDGRDGELAATIRVSGAVAGTLADALAHAGARVAALGGSLTVADDGDGATARAHVPGAA
jgi:signal transduction histidine kinase